MATQNRDYLVCAFTDRQEERRAIEDLRNAGFTGEQVEVADHSNDSKADETVAQALRDRNFPEDDARFFEDEFRAGSNLVTVRADGKWAEAETILRRHGGRMRDLAAARTAAARTAAAPVAPVAPERRDVEKPVAAMEGGRVVELKEEQLQAHKERVQTGEVDIKKRVVTEQKTLEVPVTKEEVVVERRPVAGSPPAHEPIREGEEIRIPVSEEHVEVEKRPVVKEEIVVGKRPIQETQKVAGTIRKEVAEIERKGNPNVGTPEREPHPR